MKPDDLIRHALDARARAYAPYSGFRVGAAVLTAEGELFTGANVENASYGLTICAERVALAAAAAAGARRVASLAVVSGPGASMCGACRQFLAEFADDATSILLGDGEGNHHSCHLPDLLPHAFDPNDLKREGRDDA